MRQIEKSFRNRFSALNGEPWYEALVDAYVIALDRDDEYSELKIQDGIIETAMLRGVADPGGRCGFCEKRKIELRYDGEQCHACATDDDARIEQYHREEGERKDRWAKMTEEERNDTRVAFQMFRAGLIARDVQ